MYRSIFRVPMKILLIFLVIFTITLTPLSVTSIVQADLRQVTIFGPTTIERANGKPLTLTYEVVLPTSITGPYTVKIINGVDGAPKVTSGMVAINGVKIFTQADFKRKTSTLEKQINLVLQRKVG